MEFVEYFKTELQHTGYTMWSDIQGCGTKEGEPHLGDHAWPTLNNAMLVVVEDEVVAPLLEHIRAKDELTPGLGIRAFVLNVEDMY